MTDYLLTPDLVPNDCEWTLVDFSGAQQSPLSGAVRTVSRGQRWQARMRWHDVQGDDRNYLSSLLATARGKSNRIWLADPSYDQMGSFNGAEIFPNPYFKAGLSDYGKSGDMTSVAYNRRCRMDFTGVSSGYMTHSATVVANTTYALRGFLVDGNGTGGTSHSIRFTGDPSVNIQLSQTAAGMLTLPATATASGTYTQIIARILSGQVPGDVMFSDLASLRPCALVDTGINRLLWSDDISNAAWTKSHVSTGSAVAAPDGTTTALPMIEDNTNNTHLVSQSSGIFANATDCGMCATLKANTRSWVLLQLYEATSGTTCYQWVNLATGALGSTSVGANWANMRAYVVPMASGWYRCYLIATKTNAAATVIARVYITTGDSVTSYTGDGASSIYVWRNGFAIVSTPFIPAQTTSAALVNGIAPSGSLLNVRGLPVSTTGLLRAGDRCEVNGEFKAVIADLNSDAAGCGVLFIEPSLRSSPADGAVVAIGQPFLRAVLMDGGSQPSRPGSQLFSDFDFTFAEAP